jgi:prepilin-type N-terminal cleavage/methylation domain-containing protein
VSRRHGFTLIEMLMVIVIISLTMLMALPRFRAAVNRSNMLSARAKVMASFSAARAAAAGSGRVTTLHVAGNQVWVTGAGRFKLPIGANTIDTIVLPKNLNTMYGVTATPSAGTVVVGQNGLGNSGGTTNIVLSHGNLSDTVKISQYGRVQK